MCWHVCVKIETEIVICTHLASCTLSFLLPSLTACLGCGHTRTCSVHALPGHTEVRGMVISCFV